MSEFNNNGFFDAIKAGELAPFGVVPQGGVMEKRPLVIIEHADGCSCDDLHVIAQFYTFMCSKSAPCIYTLKNTAGCEINGDLATLFPSPQKLPSGTFWNILATYFLSLFHLSMVW